MKNNEREEAEMIFSTVHRSKGMEYDAVQLVNDFVTEESIIKVLDEYEDKANRTKINEEVNLLYVAVTRTKNSIHFPETLLPKDYPRSSHIHKLRVRTAEDKTEPVVSVHPAEHLHDETHGLKKTREKHREDYKPWTEEMNDELTVMYCEGVNIRDMARHFRRSRGAIRARIKKLELEELYN